MSDMLIGICSVVMCLSTLYFWWKLLLMLDSWRLEEAARLVCFVSGMNILVWLVIAAVEC